MKSNGMVLRTEDFNYELPPELIAQSPRKARDESRLLVVGQGDAGLQDRQFPDFLDYCEPGDLLVVNNTRVVPARLYCRKLSGGKVEVMLERMLENGEFIALVRSSKKLNPGQQLFINNTAEIEFISREGAFFRFRILNRRSEDDFDIFRRTGEIPLPPYISRSSDAQDTVRYQTVYANAEGAVAAPTAGLHFDRAMLDKLENKGIEIARLTLHVGAGTFQPVKVENVEQHSMHREWVDVPADVVARVKKCKEAGHRVIAVGTTTVRALESAAEYGTLSTFRGHTEIFIYPGFKFRVVDVLLTNFHLPRSTLLMMVSAFAGTRRLKSAYQHAVMAGYRFFSYGDAMLLCRAQTNEV